MQTFAELWERIDSFLRTGIAGSAFTQLRLLTVITFVLLAKSARSARARRPS